MSCVNIWRKIGQNFTFLSNTERHVCCLLSHNLKCLKYFNSLTPLNSKNNRFIDGGTLLKIFKWKIFEKDYLYPLISIGTPIFNGGRLQLSFIIYLDPIIVQKYPLKCIHNNPNLLHYTYDFLPRLIPHCSKIKPNTPCNPFIPSVLFWKKIVQITMTQCCLFKNITRKKTKIKPWSRNLNKKWQTNE